jgi:hypothetical protein
LVLMSAAHLWVPSFSADRLELPLPRSSILIFCAPSMDVLSGAVLRAPTMDVLSLVSWRSRWWAERWWPSLREPLLC